MWSELSSSDSLRAGPGCTSAQLGGPGTRDGSSPVLSVSSVDWVQSQFLPPGAGRWDEFISTHQGEQSGCRPSSWDFLELLAHDHPDMCKEGSGVQ